MAKFKTRQVVIEAVQWKGSNMKEMEDFIADKRISNTFSHDLNGNDEIYIFPRAGVARVDPGDWVIKSKNGDFSACKEDHFNIIYESTDV